MANNYTNLKNEISALKELYSDCPDNARVSKTKKYAHKGENGYFYSSKLEAVLSDQDVNNTDFFSALVYSENPFLKMIKKDE